MIQRVPFTAEHHVRCPYFSAKALPHFVARKKEVALSSFFYV